MEDIRYAKRLLNYRPIEGKKTSTTFKETIGWIKSWWWNRSFIGQTCWPEGEWHSNEYVYE